MRDLAGNKIVICAIEYFDPMGVHTGDSITVAPAMTLPDTTYQVMRNYAFEITDMLGNFADLHDEVIQLYPSGENHVIVEFVSTGTGPDGSSLDLPVCAILTYEDGKISKDFTYKMTRLTRMPNTERVRIGIEAQSPVGEPVTHEIKFFGIERKTVEDMRKGE